ncbi:hypothetical protein AAFF_G00199680 [Aldrovandia affinis]|uniref:Uncharacterized protein n=1 Tax=Aldrovandia affinis TaxID=143900 RepID=A0AAD7RKX4_9TELE|nr:hypothetical protein AAFF_G00199680 [Aldrovandia affinis]
MLTSRGATAHTSRRAQRREVSHALLLPSVPLSLRAPLAGGIPGCRRRSRPSHGHSASGHTPFMNIHAEATNRNTRGFNNGQGTDRVGATSRCTLSLAAEGRL